jgi:hypothetical protein
LTALSRLAPQIKAEFPQAHLCFTGDALYACGRFFQICKESNWRLVVTFKPGRMPALWAEFQSLLTFCPEQVVEQILPDGSRREYRWIEKLSYEDD